MYAYRNRSSIAEVTAISVVDIECRDLLQPAKSKLTEHLVHVARSVAVNVILEGSDGSGKSTLAAYLSGELNIRVQQGSGPPRHEGEIEQRLRAYLNLDGVIFDRHPAISQPIYGMLRKELLSPEFKAMVSEFYGQPSLIIYCRATSLEKHRVKEGENPDHIAALNDNHAALLAAYDAWAVARANLIYRIGDTQDDVLNMVKVIAC